MELNLIPLVITGLFILNSEPSFQVLNKFTLRPEGGATYMEWIDKNTILTVNSKLVINVWDIENNSKLTNISSLSANHCFWSFDFSPKSRTFAYSNSNLLNNIIFFCEINDKNQIVKKKKLDFTNEFPSGPTMEYRFSPNGSLFAYSSYKEKGIVVMKTATFSPQLVLPYKSYVDSLQFIDDTLLLSISDKDEGIIWDLSGNNPYSIKKFMVPKKKRPIMDTHIDRKAQTITFFYILEPGKSGEFFEIKKIINNFQFSRHRIPLKDVGPFCLSKISPKRDYLILGSFESELKVYDLKQSSVIANYKLDDLPRSILFLDDRDRFAVDCLHGTFFIFGKR